VKRRSLFGGADFWKPALRLGFPVAMQNLLSSSFGLVDTLMLGRLGDTAVASVGMAAQWAWLLHIFFYGLSSGAAVFLSQFWGAKDVRGIRHAYGILMTLTLSLGAAMSLTAVLAPGFVMRLFSNDPTVMEAGASYLRIAGLSYLALAFSQVFHTVLRSTEQVRLPLYASLIGITLNTVLNYGLIFGKLGLPRMGIEGAALATVISAWAGPIALFIISLKRRTLIICPPRELFSFDRRFAAKFFRVSFPALLNEGLWALGTMGYNMVFGRLGTVPFAALTIFRTVDSLFFAFYIGICHACGVLVGREIGAGRIRESIRYANRFTAAMPAVTALLSVALIASRGLFLRLFVVSPEVVELAGTVLLISALEMPIRNIPYITICGVFRPGGDTHTGVKYDILSVWLMALPVTAFSGLVLGMDFVWVFVLMLVFEDWVKTALCIRRLKSLKWILPVTENREGELAA